jgi:hypothetical protein
MDCPAVPTLYPRRDGPAIRAHSRWRGCTQGEGNRIGNGDLLKEQVWIKLFRKDGHAFNSDEEGDGKSVQGSSIPHS